jgi:hypothetical protein
LILLACERVLSFITGTIVPLANIGFAKFIHGSAGALKNTKTLEFGLLAMTSVGGSFTGAFQCTGIFKDAPFYYNSA